MNADATIRRRFAADASHELRSPLASLRTGLEVALSDAEGSSWVAAATDALDTTSAMERLVQDLLFLARTDDPTAPRVVRSFDLDDVVLEEVARAGPRTPVDTSSVSAAEVIGRRDDIARVVRNLLDNALRHARSMVAVEVHGDEHGARLTVRDDGDGIAMEERDRIFERFTRLDDARSRHGGGAGLGLAIVREIVDAHGGSVRVEDAAPGARFVVDLPSV
jgi:signal transduction histidine kinase